MFAEGVEAVAGSDSGALGLSASLSVDIAQLKSTSVVTHEHDRLRPKGSARQGFDQSRSETPGYVPDSGQLCF